MIEAVHCTSYMVKIIYLWSVTVMNNAREWTSLHQVTLSVMTVTCMSTLDSSVDTVYIKTGPSTAKAVTSIWLVTQKSIIKVASLC